MVKVFELSTVDMTLYKFVLPLMKELRLNGFEVLCGAGNHGYLSKIADEGFTVYDIPFRRSLNPMAILRSFINLVKIFRRERVDILHTHTPIASFVGRIAAVFSGVKVKIYTVHGFILRPRIYEYLERLMAKAFTSFIITVNQEDYTYVLAKRFAAPNKIINLNSVGVDVHHFNPNVICTDDTAALRERLKLSKEPVIGYVGRIVKSKGVLDLIHAFIAVRRTSICKLLLVGPWDMSERANDSIIDEIRLLLQEHRLEEEVIFTGQREDVAELLSVMDIFVLPSYREGMPVSLLEAMAMEKVVIGTDIRGIREEITEDCGFTFKPQDIDALTVHLHYCLEHLDRVKEMGERARQRVVLHFSLEKALAKQIPIFLDYGKTFTNKG